MEPDGDALFEECLKLPAGPKVQVLKRGIRYSHAAMIDVLIAEPWIRQNDLAKRFDRTPSWISTIMSSDAFQSAFAARKEEIQDPILKLSVEEHTRGIFMRSLAILKDKLDQPSAEVPDQLAIQTFAQSARALGYGARQDSQPTVSITNHIEVQADNLVALLRREKLKISEESHVETQTIEGTFHENGRALGSEGASGESTEAPPNGVAATG
jgi:hypothetical protein